MDISQTGKTVNEKQIAFIICTNDQLKLDECLMYLSFFRIPEGFSTDVITIDDAPGMCAGYNAAMKESNASVQTDFIIDTRTVGEAFNKFQKCRQMVMRQRLSVPDPYLKEANYVKRR